MCCLPVNGYFRSSLEATDHLYAPVSSSNIVVPLKRHRQHLVWEFRDTRVSFVFIYLNVHNLTSAVSFGWTGTIHQLLAKYQLIGAILSKETFTLYRFHCKMTSQVLLLCQQAQPSAHKNQKTEGFPLVTSYVNHDRNEVVFSKLIVDSHGTLLCWFLITSITRTSFDDLIVISVLY